jgi:hypothetical protein
MAECARFKGGEITIKKINRDKNNLIANQFNLQTGLSV